MNTRALALIFLLPFVTSCLTQRQAADYESEISALREERTALKSENNSLRGQLDSTQVALSDASSELNSARTQPAPAAIMPQLSGGIEVGMRGGNLVIVVPSSITFSSGSATLAKGGKGPLSEVAALLKREHPDGQYWIEGHTDSDQIKKSKSKFSSNRDLSTQRAMSVLAYLVEECGIADDSCVLVGHGQYSSVASNDSKAGKAKNRRVEIVVH